MQTSDERDFDDASGSLQSASERPNASFHLEVNGVEARWGVRTVSLREGIGEPFQGIVEALEEAGGPEAAALLGKRFMLRVERGDQQRTVRGLIRQASAVELPEGTQYTVHIVASIWQLALGYETRTHRATTIPELVRSVVQRRLGSSVVVDTELLTQTYETHDFLVQYQESDLNFLNRWMEQEGVFWFLADGEDEEKLVLADAVDGLPFARSSDDGRIMHRGLAAAGETETVFDLRHSQELGATRFALREFDWTNPSLEITADHAGSSPLDPPPEVYDHTDSILSRSIVMMVASTGITARKRRRGSADRASS